MREMLSTVLTRSGYRPLLAPDGEAGLGMFASHRPELVLLDLGLPVVDGWNVLQRLRADDDETGILVLSGTHDEPSKVRALSGGADDFLVKPVGAAELVARMGAVLRRSTGQVRHALPAAVHDDGLVRIDFQRRQVHVAGQDVVLSPLEFRLLTVLVESRGEVLSRADLLERVWNDTSGGSSDHVKIYIGYLRRKLAAVTSCELISTVRGFGYRWSLPAAQAGHPLPRPLSAAR